MMSLPLESSALFGGLPNVPMGGSPEGHRLAERAAEIRMRIDAAARRVGRDPGAVSMVAVTKGFPAAVAADAAAAGLTDLGESRAHELQAKHPQVAGVRWHFVGRLQRNKIGDVVGTAHLIHSLDRVELAEGIGQRAERLGRVQPVLVQVNVGDDPDKGGCSPQEVPELVARARSIDGLLCLGLMTMPPRDTDPRPIFSRLRELLETISGQFPEVRHLSMGMSGDFELAVEEGATMVRIGEALFGPRSR